MQIDLFIYTSYNRLHIPLQVYHRYTISILFIYFMLSVVSPKSKGRAAQRLSTALHFQVLPFKDPHASSLKLSTATLNLFPLI